MFVFFSKSKELRLLRQPYRNPDTRKDHMLCRLFWTSCNTNSPPCSASTPVFLFFCLGVVAVLQAIAWLRRFVQQANHQLNHLTKQRAAALADKLVKDKSRSSAKSAREGANEKNKSSNKSYQTAEHTAVSVYFLRFFCLTLPTG